MTALLSIVDDQLSEAVRTWLLSLISCEVVRGLDNRVAPLQGSGIIFTPLTNNHLSTTVEGYDYNTLTNLKTSMERVMQIDCYGPLSPDWATIIANVWRSSSAVLFLKSLFIAPLFCDDPTQVPFTSGEDQYEERWTLKLHLQYNPVVTLTQDFATTVKVTSTNVERVYPL